MGLLFHLPLNREDYHEQTQMSESLLLANPTKYYTKDNFIYTQCSSSDIYSEEETYYYKYIRSKGQFKGNLYANDLTYNTNGKLGGCYSFNGSTSKAYTDKIPNGTNFSKMSLSCWFKANNVSTTQYIVSLNNGGGYADHLIGLAIENSKLVILGGGISSLNYTISANTWYHCTVVLNNSPASLQYYINGIYQGSVTPNTTRANGYHLTVGARANSNLGAGIAISYPFNGFLNDVQIYNNILSKKEIKRIASGLTTHYSFQGKYLKETTNLLNGNIANCVGGWSNWCSSGGTTPTTQYLTGDGVYSTHYLKETVYKNATNNCAPYTSYTATANTLYTFSCFVKGTVDSYGETVTAIHWTNNGTTTLQEQYEIELSDEWQLVYASFSCSAQSSVMCGLRAASTTKNIQYYVCNAQLEKNDLPTNWIAGGGNVPAQDCIDESGFDNNGIMSTEELNLQNDSKRHTKSVLFNSNNVSFVPFLSGATNFSISFWMAPNAATPSGCPLSLEHDTYWQITFYSNTIGIRDNSMGTTGTRKNYSLGTFTANQWTHIAVTYNAGTLKVYNNGQLLSTNTVGGTALNVDINNGRIGSAVQTGYNYAGKVSDVRIYNTTLSNEDILDLYQTIGSIDNNGNLYCYDFIESLDFSSSMSEQGLLESESFSELGTTTSFIREESSFDTNQIYEI